jgi:hypothetical protein
MTARPIAQHRFYSATVLEGARNPLIMAERTGLEPATPGVTGRYSNQLNYRSGWGGESYPIDESGFKLFPRRLREMTTRSARRPPKRALPSVS